MYVCTCVKVLCLADIQAAFMLKRFTHLGTYGKTNKCTSMHTHTHTYTYTHTDVTAGWAASLVNTRSPFIQLGGLEQCE